MKTLGRWAVAGLFVAWLIAELVAAFDGIPETWTLTRIVVTGLPWPVTAGIIAVGVPALIWHFAVEYRRRADRLRREEIVKMIRGGTSVESAWMKVRQPPEGKAR